MTKKLTLIAAAMLSAVVAFAQPQGGPGGFPGGGQGFGGQRPEGQNPQRQRQEGGRPGMREGMPPVAIYQATEEDLASKSIVVYTSYKSKAEASAVLVDLLKEQNYTLQAASSSTVLAYKTLAQMQQDAMAEMQAKMQERMGERAEGERPQGRPEGMPGGFPGGFPGGGMPPMGGGFPGGGMPPMMMGGGFPGFPGMGGSSTVQENEITAKIGGNASKGITITFKCPKPSKEGNPVFNETGKLAKMIPGTTKVEYIPR